MHPLMGRYLSLGSFVLVVLCFLLPFCSITCSGEKIVTFSGIELAFGASKQFASGFGSDSKQERTPVVTTALLCLLAAAVGATFSVLGGRGRTVVRLILGAAGLILLLLIQGEVKGKLIARSDAAGGAIGLKTEIGWTLAMLFYLASAVINGISLFQAKHAPAAATVGHGCAPPNQNKQPPPSGFCTRCGRPLTLDERFCPDCGTEKT